MKKTIIIGSIVSIIFLFIGILVGKNIGNSELNLSAVPGVNGYTCIYNTTSSAYLRNGQSAAASCDQKGNLLISPSTTINLIGS